jgi:hypothetical protein
MARISIIVAFACKNLAASGIIRQMKYWEIVADRLHADGWSYGIAEHLTKHGLPFCVDAPRDEKRFIVKADDLLTAFLSLERDAIALKAKREIGWEVSLHGLLARETCQSKG